MGVTSDIQTRVCAHISGKGAKWTREHKPSFTLCCYLDSGQTPVFDHFHEVEITLRLIETLDAGKQGSQWHDPSVRGAAWALSTLTDGQLREIR